MKRYLSLILAIAATVSAQIVPSTGNVRGPTSATDNAVARYDGTTGKLIQNSGVTIDDSGNLAVSGTGNSDFSGSIRLANNKFLYGYTTAGATGSIAVGTSSDNLNIGQNNANWAALNLYGGTGNVSIIPTGVTAATFTSTTATLSGNLTVSGGTATVSGSSGYLKLTSTSASKTWDLFADSGGSFFIAHSGVLNALQIAPTTGNATLSGNLKLSAYGAGTLTTDSSGNVTATSDERAKNIIGTFTKGLAEVVKLTPKTYTWKPETGLNPTDEVVSLTAQDLIAAGLPEAVSTYRTVADLNDDGTPKLDADGKPLTKRIDATYTVSDRAVIAALVNAVKELKAEVDALKAARN